MAKRAAILYCKKIKDISCVACAKCFKGIALHAGEFARFDDLQIVGMTHCGDCPGLTVPRVNLLRETLKGLGQELDVVYLGTCMKGAMESAECPIDFDALKTRLSKKFGVEVILGTHPY
ncbi:MAG: CGGC domain-containing protein [Candidatus Binataceae bacterium]